MLVIGEKVNVMSKTVGPAMKSRDAGPVRQMALHQVEGGADVLDINLGPATKGGPEMMEWVVNTVQEACPDTRLCLDTMNPEAMEAGLKVCKLQPIINSTSAERARIETFMPLAKTYDAEIIALAMDEKGVSRDADERAEKAMTIMAACDEFGIAYDRVYIDPLLLPVCVAQHQAVEAINAVMMFKALAAPPFKTTVGLSNIYNGCPEHTKSPLAAALLAMLMEVGLDSAIMDANDERQMRVARGDVVFDSEMERAAAILRNEELYASSFLD